MLRYSTFEVFGEFFQQTVNLLEGAAPELEVLEGFTHFDAGALKPLQENEIRDNYES